MANATLLLDVQTNDLVLNAQGDIAVATAPYSYAQDVCSAIKLFQGELFYAANQGLPYWTQILGQYPSMPLVKHYIQQAALSVPGISSATVYLTSFSARQLSGQVQLTLSDGTTTAANF